MAVLDCIQLKAEEGLASKRKVKEFTDELSRRIDQARTNNPALQPGEEQLIAESLLQELRDNLTLKQRMTVQQARVQRRIQEVVDDAIANGRADKIDRIMQAHLATDYSGVYRGSNVHTRTEAIRNDLHGRMDAAVWAFRSRLFDFRRKVNAFDNVARELFGEDTGDDAAKAMSKGIQEAAEHARLRYNAAGGAIPFRKNWGFFQTHNAEAVSRVSEEEWVSFVESRIDPEQMIGENGQVLSPKELSGALRALYREIKTRGLSNLPEVPGPKLHASNINVRANHRFLVFKDADSWLQYHKQFGEPDMVNHIVSSLDKMARDIAILEIMGPYPQATIRFMEKKIDEGLSAAAESAGPGKKAAKFTSRIGAPKRNLNNLWHEVSGANSISVNPQLSNTMGDVRNFLTSGVLLGAFMSAIADVAPTGWVSRMNGVPVWKMWRRQLKLFVGGVGGLSNAEKRQAIRLGFGTQGTIARALGAQRVLGEVTGRRWSELLADKLLRASLLSPWTEGGRWAVPTEIVGLWTSQASKTWDSIPRTMRETFEFYGIGEQDWNLYRATEPFTDPETGASFIRPRDMMDDFSDEKFQTAVKLQEMLAREVEVAVPTSSPRVRAFLTGSQPDGTLWGTFARSSAMFKAFPASVMITLWRRAASQRRFSSKAEAAAWLFVGMSVMGAVGEQMRSISQGKNPEPVDNADFWLRAAMRGGSFGLAGDLVLREHDINGQRMAEWVVGPVFGAGFRATAATATAVRDLLAGEDTTLGRDVFNLVTNYSPPFRLWYTQLAWDRLLLDELETMIDPEAHRRFNRQIRKAQRERNQSFFSPPGQGLQLDVDLEEALP